MSKTLTILKKRVARLLRDAAKLHEQLPKSEIDLIVKASVMIERALRGGSKIIWLGNGGSATQSQHMAAEFVGRFAKERRSLSSIALTENVATITAIGNDYSFDQIFSRQIEGLSKSGDIVVAMSTSGNSPNVISAIRSARRLHLGVIGLSGSSGGQMLSLCDLCIRVPSTITARIQEVHLTIGHILCALVEDDALMSSRAIRAR